MYVSLYIYIERERCIYVFDEADVEAVLVGDAHAGPGGEATGEEEDEG